VETLICTRKLPYAWPLLQHFKWQFLFISSWGTSKGLDSNSTRFIPKCTKGNSYITRVDPVISDQNIWSTRHFYHNFNRKIVMIVAKLSSLSHRCFNVAFWVNKSSGRANPGFTDLFMED
jgi:hypothetical protein